MEEKDKTISEMKRRSYEGDEKMIDGGHSKGHKKGEK